MPAEIYRIKPLEWREEEPNWWAATPDVFGGGRGYEVRVTDRGRVRVRRFSEDWQYFEGTEAEAKAAAYNDFKERIFSAIEFVD